ncbi:MAG TPA: hypothetical protein VJZ76_07600 [Thermoanaerobaculia bacterium]|nr:hypothetical protein [Thermoanaerobaculia bacterium]
MAILDFIERLINAVYSTPNPQVGTYFRDLRVVPKPQAPDDDDSMYHHEPETNDDKLLLAATAIPAATAKAPRLSARDSEPVSAAMGRR